MTRWLDRLSMVAIGNMALAAVMLINAGLQLLVVSS
jgi:hypothetical protein